MQKIWENFGSRKKGWISIEFPSNLPFKYQQYPVNSVSITSKNLKIQWVKKSKLKFCLLSSQCSLTTDLATGNEFDERKDEKGTQICQ